VSVPLCPAPHATALHEPSLRYAHAVPRSAPFSHLLRLCCRAQYDELKAKKELIEKSLEEKTAEEEKKRKAQEKLNMKSKKKAKATLSFDADEEEGQV
jgi:hypothetical protein